MLDQLTGAEFAPYVGQTFAVRLDPAAPIPLELMSVDELGAASAPPGAGRRPFSLLFLGPPGPAYLRQQIYRLEHERLGALELFLVPLGPEGGRMRYECIFT